MSSVEKSAVRPGVTLEEDVRKRSQRLNKTCRKHNIFFGDYLKDQLCGLNEIPFFSDLMASFKITLHFF